MCSKRVYPTRGEAERERRRLRERDLRGVRVYRCKTCGGGYHIGHSYRYRRAEKPRQKRWETAS